MGTDGYFVVTDIGHGLSGREAISTRDRDDLMANLAAEYADRKNLRNGSRLVVAETPYWRVYEVTTRGSVGGKRRVTHIDQDGNPLDREKTP